MGWEDPLEKGKAAHSSILAWRIPWTVESMGLQKVRHDFRFHFFDTEIGFLILSCITLRKSMVFIENETQYNVKERIKNIII